MDVDGDLLFMIVVAIVFGIGWTINSCNNARNFEACIAHHSVAECKELRE
jgi:hypothetical protein